MDQVESTGNKKSIWLQVTLLLTGSMTVMAGAGITAATPAIGRFFAGIENVELLSKLLLTIPSLMIAVLAPFAGQIIDRVGRKKPLLVSLFLYALAGTSGLYLDNIYLILAGRALLGVAVAGIMTINTTLIGDYFHGIGRSRFMGWQGAFMSFGGVLFVSVGGLLADISWRMPFLIYTFSLVILVLAVFFIDEPEIESREKALRPKPRQGRKMRKYYLVYATAFLGMLFFYVIPVQVPFLLQKVTTLSNSVVGYSISIAVLAGAIVSYNYGRIRMRFNFYEIYVFTFVMMGTGFVLVSFFHSYSGILTGLIVAGFGTGMLMPNTNLWLISLAPPQRRGRLVGVLNLSVYAGQFLSPLFLFPVIQWHSLQFSFGAGGAVMLLIAAVFFILNRRN